MAMFLEQQNGEVVHIKCPSSLDQEEAEAFAAECKAWLLKSAEYFVIDFSGVLAMSRSFYKAIIQFKSVLKKDKKHIYSVNLSKSLLHQITGDGVEMAFNPVESMSDLPRKAVEHKDSRQLNVDFLNPFLTAIKKTFEVQCRTKVEILKPRVKKEPFPGIVLAGVLSLISNGFSGSIVLCFSEAVFLKIYENMFDEKHSEITAEIEDAAAELLNIVYGSAKVELNQKGYNFQKALPTVLGGEKIIVRQSGLKPAVVIPVETEAGPFYVEIEFDDGQGRENV